MLKKYFFLFFYLDISKIDYTFELLKSENIMEKTLVILKPSAIQRELVGTVIARFEKKGIQLVGVKMMQLTDEILTQHYAHLVGKPFFPRLCEAMKVTPVIVCCFEGIDCVQVVRNLTGVTNGRNAQAGTIRGDFSISGQENIVHASDSIENAVIEINRFFKPEEIFTYQRPNLYFIYATDEI
jgi:nucleoside-diphosphate kinase